jgi:hypothetical protein
MTLAYPVAPEEPARLIRATTGASVTVFMGVLLSLA